MPYTIQEASEKIGVSIKTIRRYIQRGKFPGTYKQNGKFYIPDVDIMPFLFEMSSRTPPDTLDNAVQSMPGNLSELNQKDMDMDTPGHPGQPAQSAQRSQLVIDWKWLGIHYERDVYIKDKQRFHQVKLNLFSLAISGGNLLEATGKKLKEYFQQRKALIEGKEREE